MKKVLVFAMAMALGVSATAFAANPFSDVPQGHWAYSAVAELAASGVVTGFPDGTFKGDMTMTRYEMAQIVAKALAKGSINENDALVAEFADELDNLGVRVSSLEKKSDNIKVTGSLRYRYYAHDMDDIFDDIFVDKSQLRSRVSVIGKINDEWTYNGLIESYKSFGHNISSNDDNTYFSRAWVEGKTGETNLKVGNFRYVPQSSNIIISKASNVFDCEMNGAKVDFNVGALDIALAYGREYFVASDSNLFIGTVDTKIGATDASIGYYNGESNNDLDDVSILTLGLDGEVLPDTILSGMALKGSKRAEGVDDFGYVLGLQYKKIDKNVVGSYSISANYYNQPMSTYIWPTVGDISGLDELIGVGNYSGHGVGFVASIFDGFKGYRVGVDYTVAKNIVASIYYVDLKTRGGNIKDKVILSQLDILF